MDAGILERQESQVSLEVSLPAVRSRVYVTDKGTTRGSAFLRAVLKHSGSGKRRALTVL